VESLSLQDTQAETSEYEGTSKAESKDEDDEEISGSGS